MKKWIDGISSILILSMYFNISDVHSKAVGWFYQCNDEINCKIYAYDKLPSDKEPNLKLRAYVVSITSDYQITFEEVWSKSFHEYMFTYHMPISYKIENEPVVRKRISSYLHPKFPIDIHIGTSSFKADSCTTQLCVIKDKFKIDAFIEGVKSGQEITINRVTKDSFTNEWKDNILLTLNNSSNISRLLLKLDFDKKRVESTTKAQNKTTFLESYNHISTVFSKHKFGRNAGKLLMTKNTKGKGYFIYANKLKTRPAIWFYYKEKAIALNSPAITITPNLDILLEVHPLEGVDSFWNDVGIKRNKLPYEGIIQAYH